MQPSRHVTVILKFQVEYIAGQLFDPICLPVPAAVDEGFYARVVADLRDTLLGNMRTTLSMPTPQQFTHAILNTLKSRGCVNVGYDCGRSGQAVCSIAA